MSTEPIVNEAPEAISLSRLAPHIGDDDIGLPSVPEELKARYTTLYFLWLKEFIAYQDGHAMGPLRAALSAGLDPISLDYLEHHERLLELCRSNAHCLVDFNLAWTEEDRRLFAQYQECKAAQTPAFLATADYSLGTCYTNSYGLYDLPEDVCVRIKGKAIIDAGAYNGDTTLLLRAKFPQSVCYSFEPDRDNFNYFSRCFKRDIAKGKVQAIQKALGDKPGVLKLNKAVSPYKLNESASLAYDYHSTAYDVDVITVDDFVREQQLEVGLIKLDVEGFELPLIQGALTTIKTQRPVLCIGFYHFPEEFYELKPFLESLGLNYQFQIRRSNFVQNIHEPPAVPLYDLVLIAY